MIHFFQTARVWLVAPLFPALGWTAGAQEIFKESRERQARIQAAVKNADVKIHWLAGGAWLWFKNERADGAVWTLADARTGAMEPLLDMARLREALAAAGVEADALQAGVSDVSVSDDGSVVTLSAVGRVWTWRRKEGTLEPATADTAGLAQRAVPRRSRSGGAVMSQKIVNRTAGMIRLFWLDEDGQRRSYGTVAAGESKDQRTYAGHVWLITDDEGKELTAFEGDDARREIKVTGAVEFKWAEPEPRRERRGRREDGPLNRERSPDGGRRVEFRDYNVVLHTPDGESILTTDGTAEDGYEGPVLWAPDGRRAAVMRRRQAGPERKVTVVRSSSRDGVQPQVETWDYAKPGDPLPAVRPRIVDAQAKRLLPTSDELFSNPFDTGSWHWAADSSAFHFLYNERGHQLLRIVALDAATGAASALLDERAATFVDYSQKTWLHWLDRTAEFLWTSERDGWNHLYLCDARTGAVKRQVTKGEWLVRSVQRVDEEKRTVLARVMGIYPEQDPYHMHWARIGIDDGAMTLLTDADGTHEEPRMAPDGESYVVKWSRTDHAPVMELRRTSDGRKLAELARGDTSALPALGWRAPERFSAKGRDGKTDIWGVINWPHGYDVSKKYPVIEYIYAGPHDFHVPKHFRSSLQFQEVADLGFIMVFIDGMGTNWRSKAFHDVAWRNLGDAGFPDRIAWMRAAAEKHPSMDLSRVGIFGGSAGGQNAMRALIAHGDFYKAAAADCGCHDNRMDKIWWNEAWMGLPGPHYIESSNVEQAHRLQGHLLLTVGEMDRNVDPASTMQVVNALIKADKDFDFHIIPNGGHGVGESPWASRQRAEFFVRHLRPGT